MSSKKEEKFEQDPIDNSKQSENNDIEGLKKTMEDLQQQISQLQKEKNDIFGQLQRVTADYLNFQKRTAKNISETIAYEKEKIIMSLLPALDNFEHTLQNIHSVKEIDTLNKGIQIIHKQLLDILKSHGVEQIESVGKSFDPHTHEVIMQKADPTKKENTILTEYQKGYQLNSRIIRPSKVIINKLTSQEAPAKKDNANQTQIQQPLNETTPNEVIKEDPSSQQGSE